MAKYEWNMDSSWHTMAVQLLKLLLVWYWDAIMKDWSALAGAAHKLRNMGGNHNYKDSAVDWLLLNLIIPNKMIYS